MNSTVRGIAGTMAGILVAFALLWIAQYAGSALSPDVYDPSTGEVLIPIGSTIALFIGWFVGTFAGSWLAMRVSGNSGAGWVVAGAILGASLYRAVTLADQWWVMAMGIVIPLAAAWAAQRASALAPAHPA